jgi:hypothetical protein
VPWYGKLKVLTGVKVMNISDHFMTSAKMSVHKSSQQTGISYESISRALKKS